MPELIEKTIYSGQEFFPKPIFSREEIVAELRIVMQRLLSTESPEFSEAALDKVFANFTGVIDAKKTAHGCCELGVSHYLAGKKGQAILFYLKALQIAPDSFEALHNIGVVFSDLNQDNHAEGAYLLAIQANSKHLISWLDLGKIYLTRNYNHGAVFAFGQAADIDSKCAEAWKGLGIALRGLLEIQKATEANRRALELKPDDAEVWMTFAFGLALESKFDGAIEAARKTLGFNPNNDEARLLLAELLKPATREEFFDKFRYVLLKGHLEKLGVKI